MSTTYPGPATDAGAIDSRELRRCLTELAQQWQLTASEVESLLHLPRGTWDGPTPPFEADALARAQALLQLYTDLSILFGDSLANAWIRRADPATGRTHLEALATSTVVEIRQRSAR